MASSTAAGARTFDDLDPATGDVLATLPVADETEVRAAVARARAAQPAWAALGLNGRIAALEQAAVEFERPELLDELGLLITREMGKPLEQARQRRFAGQGRQHLAGQPGAAHPRLHHHGDVGRRHARASGQREGSSTSTETVPSSASRASEKPAGSRAAAATTLSENAVSGMRVE